MSIAVMLAGLAFLVAIEAGAWVIGYRRSTSSGMWRKIDANLTVIGVNVAIIALGAIGAAVKELAR